MSTEINKTPTESEYCICNKPCPILHTDVQSSIKDQSKDLLNEEVIIHNIKKNNKSNRFCVNMYSIY